MERTWLWALEQPFVLSSASLGHSLEGRIGLALGKSSSLIGYFQKQPRPGPSAEEPTLTSATLRPEACSFPMGTACSFSARLGAGGRGGRVLGRGKGGLESRIRFMREK